MPRLSLARRHLLVLASLLGLGALPARAVEIPAAAAGPYAVGSTNMQVSLPAGDTRPMMDYLVGKQQPPKPVYMDEILTHPTSALMLKVTVPASHPFAFALAGQTVPVLLYVLYPTTNDNPRPHYRFPYKDTGDNVFPHMQRPGEAPIFADPAARYPVIVYSGGLNTHGLWHLAHLKTLASHGYVVVDIFHGDARAGDGRTPGYFEAFALRQAAFKAATDFILSDPAFAAHVDPDRVGASGASAGGQTILSMMGGVRPGVKRTAVHDARIKAGFGTVPFTGTSFGVWPMEVDSWFFGKDYAGLANVKVPYFAIAGEKDTSCPSETVQASARRIGAPAWVVELKGAGHDLGEAVKEALAWELVFFDAHLRGNAAARALLAPGNTVSGGSLSRMVVSPAPR